MRSLSLVMSECSLSGHGQGHVSNFYIVDLENFATASRQYTGDIHNSDVVGLFMTPVTQWKRLYRVVVECTWVHVFITHRPTVTLQLHNFDLFRTCRTSSCTLLCGNWQDFNWHDASRGSLTIAELLVYCRYLLKDQLKGPSDVEGFVRALKKGCRYIERKFALCSTDEIPCQWCW